MADNLAARRLYSRLGATSMNDAWMVWEQIGESLRKRRFAACPVKDL